MIRRLISAAVLLTSIVVSGWIMFGVYISKDEIGVRYFYKGSEQGISSYILSPGLTWRIPFVCDVQKLPTSPRELVLMNNSPKGPNPHRNALYTPGGHRTYQNVVVTYLMLPDAALEYTQAFWSIPPDTIVEGYVRTCALSTKDDFNELKKCANKILNRIGIKILHIQPYSRKAMQKSRKRNLPGQKGKNKLNARTSK